MPSISCIHNLTTVEYEKLYTVAEARLFPVTVQPAEPSVEARMRAILSEYGSSWEDVFVCDLDWFDSRPAGS